MNCGLGLRMILVIGCLTALALAGEANHRPSPAGAYLPGEQGRQYYDGLIGLWYEGNEFERSSGRHLLMDIDGWVGPGPQDWAGRWWGAVEAPYTGEVTFRAEVNGGIKLQIGDKVVIDGMDDDKGRSGNISMIRGEKYPIVISYYQERPPGYLKLCWSWDGKKESIVDRSVLSHTQKDREYVKGQLGYQYVDEEKVLERVRFWKEDEAPIHFTGEGGCMS